MNYKVHSKVNWNITVMPDWRNLFYPSLVKKLDKSNAYFEENVEFKIVPLNNIEEALNFFSLYDKEIGSRHNYAYRKDEQKHSYQERLKLKPYFQAIITKKHTNDYVGGMIFSIFNDKLSFGLRSFNKNFRKALQKETTIDYWAEEKIHEFAYSKKLQAISHGTETYPNQGRTGLILFKLKIGGRPKLSKKQYDILDISQEELSRQEVPFFFWTDPDKDGYFKKAHIFYSSNNLKEDVLSELVKVIEWSKIELMINKHS